MGTVAKTVRAAKTESAGKLVVNEAQERRIPTPRQDLTILRKGGRQPEKTISEGEDAASLLLRLAQAIRTPGISRDSVFPATARKPAYAFYVSARDLTSFVREDVNGTKVMGRFVGGKFKASRAKSA